jgi:MFS family permease
MQRAQDISAVVGGSANSVWLTSSVIIFNSVLSPPVSQAADYWGRRWFLIILTGCGVVGSIIVARATTMNMAIAGTSITGLSYGAQPLLHAVASEVLPRKYRPYAQAADNVAVALGGLVALLVGGAMTRHGNHAGFRNYWYMATAVFALATVLVAALYNPPPQKSQMGLTNREKLAKLDWIGYFLFTSGLVLFTMGLSWSQNPYSWSDAHILATFIIGVALIVAFAVYETKFKRDGMFHHDLFANNWNFVIALVCVFVEGLAFLAANNYFAFEISVLYETDPLRTAVRYSIAFILYTISTILTGAFCSNSKKVRIPTIVAFGFMIAFFICMATATPGSSNAVWGYPVLLGIGLGMCLCTLVTVAQLSTPPEMIAITSGLMICMRSLGGTVGLAICMSLSFFVKGPLSLTLTL